MIGTGNFNVADSADRIEDNIATIDGALEVATNDGDLLTLTAEYNQLDDEDTNLVSGYKIQDEADAIAQALIADDPSVNGAGSVTTNGGAVSLTFAEADALLNGNGVAPSQTGTVEADVTVSGTISVAEASACWARPMTSLTTPTRLHGP